MSIRVMDGEDEMAIIDGFEFEPVDASALVSVVRRLAEQNSDFVYIPESGVGGACLYTHSDGEPGCIIGCGLAEMGISIPHNSELNRMTGVDSLCEQGIIQVTDPRVRHWLCGVQSCQDSALSWGKSVESTDDSFND